ncbi:MAG: hypothetical protein PHF02_02485 [Tepidiphilus sp.]|jgi:hypothetical protein|nr:hypothetical protein [Tepidiphilus sp.]MDD3432838.1 hypothetical protein [Tepidiphilus sp.]
MVRDRRTWSVVWTVIVAVLWCYPVAAAVADVLGGTAQAVYVFLVWAGAVGLAFFLYRGAERDDAER